MQSANIDPERLSKLDSLDINYGAHGSFAKGHCAMEMVAWLAGEEHSDHPRCTCTVIGAFVRRFNDLLRNDAERNEFIKPLLASMVGTSGSRELREKRAYLAVDWSIRTMLPILYRALALNEEANDLERTTCVVDRAGALRARSVVLDARSRANEKLKAAKKTYAAAAAAAAAAAYAAYAAADAAAAAADAYAAAAADAAADAAAAADADADAAAAAADAAADAADAAADAAAYADADADAAAAAAAAAAARRQRLIECRREINLSAADLIKRMCALTDQEPAN